MKYRELHKEEIRAYHKEYYKNNKEKTYLQSKKYSESHKDRKAASSKKYRESHKERHKEYLQRPKTKENAIKVAHNRRARQKELEATLTTEQWEQIKLYFNNKCAYCGKNKTLEQDHFLALHHGGEYTHNNIIPSCESCNKSKREKDFFIWYPKQRFYSKEREQKILKFLHYKNGIQQLSLF